MVRGRKVISLQFFPSSIKTCELSHSKGFFRVINFSTFGDNFEFHFREAASTNLFQKGVISTFSIIFINDSSAMTESYSLCVITVGMNLLSRKSYSESKSEKKILESRRVNRKTAATMQ